MKNIKLRSPTAKPIQINFQPPNDLADPIIRKYSNDLFNYLRAAKLYKKSHKQFENKKTIINSQKKREKVQIKYEYSGFQNLNLMSRNDLLLNSLANSRTSTCIKERPYENKYISIHVAFKKRKSNATPKIQTECLSPKDSTGFLTNIGKSNRITPKKKIKGTIYKLTTETRLHNLKQNRDMNTFGTIWQKPILNINTRVHSRQAKPINILNLTCNPSLSHESLEILKQQSSPKSNAAIADKLISAKIQEKSRFLNLVNKRESCGNKHYKKDNLAQKIQMNVTCRQIRTVGAQNNKTIFNDFYK